MFLPLQTDYKTAFEVKLEFGDSKLNFPASNLTFHTTDIRNCSSSRERREIAQCEAFTLFPASNPMYRLHMCKIHRSGIDEISPLFVCCNPLLFL